MNTNLRDNQSLWQKKVDDLETRLRKVEEEKAKETQDLKEQLRYDKAQCMKGQREDGILRNHEHRAGSLSPIIVANH